MLYIQELSLFEYTLLLIFLRLSLLSLLLCVKIFSISKNKNKNFLVAGDEKASVTIVHRTSQ